MKNCKAIKGSGNDYALFTDVSLNPKLKVGIGAYLFIPGPLTDIDNDDLSNLAKNIVTRKFLDTTSTKLEVQTVIWALEEYRNGLKRSSDEKLFVYTDSQCVAGLPERRTGLEAKKYISRRTNRLLKNASLYREFLRLHDLLGFKVIKVAGHTRMIDRDLVHHVFSIVDRKVRKEMKND